jgi:hypothetical protein
MPSYIERDTEGHKVSSLPDPTGEGVGELDASLVDPMSDNTESGSRVR